MEIALLNTNGFCEDAILSVRAGQQRRQAAATDALPFRFPKLTMEESPIRFDVYKPMGTAHLILKPGEDQYKVTFSGANPMTCEVEIRGETPVAAPPAVEGDDPYFEKHGILPFLRAMVAAMAKETPADPYEYMARQMASGYGVVHEVRAPGSKMRPSVKENIPPAEAGGDSTMKQIVSGLLCEAVESADEAEVAGEVGAADPNNGTTAKETETNDVETAVTPTAAPNEVVDAAA